MTEARVLRYMREYSFFLSSRRFVSSGLLNWVRIG
jgi:hypothetical protein